MANQIMRFVGVSTSNSSINKVFPLWAQILGLDAQLIGLDIPIGASAQEYRKAIVEMRDDPRCVGALVTTHKIALYEAAKDMFKSFDQFATACGEVSSVKTKSGEVFGSAKDPITAGLALSEFLETNHFSTGAQVVCFGDGGAATAIAWYLTGLAIPPAKINFFGLSNDRLNHLKKVVSGRNGTSSVVINQSNPEAIANTLSNLPDGSVIINATGMGKDLPGSPMPEGVHFPRNCIVWELNYRGSLDFLKQAESEAASANLKVVDGWRYFIYGWSSVISEVFDIKLTPEMMTRLSAAAEIAR